MGWYVVAAKAAMSLVQGASAAKQESRNNIAQNEMIQAYNKKVMYESMEQVTQINLQRAQQREQTAASLYNITLQGQSARDQITTQAAATDTIGASVSDAISTVNQKQGQAVGSAQEQYMNAIEQSNLMIKKTTQQGINSLKDAVSNNVAGIMNQTGWSIAGQVLGKVAGDAASSQSQDAPAPISAAQGSTPISYDYQGANTSNSMASSNPFGLSFGIKGS